MKIIINGGTGFIGSHLINELQLKNHEIISIKRELSRPRIELEKEPKWVLEKDKTQLKNALKNCKFFINCAAVGVSPQKADWEKLVDYNIKRTFSLLVLAKKAGIKDFLFLGTEMELNIEDLYSFESNDNLSPYAASKTSAFFLFCSYAKLNNLNMKYIKIPNVYGEGQYSKNLWPSLRRAALSGDNYKILNKNTTKSFISVAKVSKIIAKNLSVNSSKKNSVDIISIEGKKMKVGEFAMHYWKKWQASGKLIFQEK